MAVVTIARQFGALADEVGAALAERLDYKLVDKHAVTNAVRAFSSMDVSSNVPEIEEKQPSFWERLNEERQRYRVMLRTAMLEFAEQDRAVIMGMGGGFILSEFSHVLQVFVTSPFAIRVDRVARGGTPERPGPMDRDAARDVVRHMDRERAGYVRYLFNVDWTDPSNYALVLNTGRLGVPDVVEVLASGAERANLALTPESSRRLADALLASRVEVTLLGNAGIWVHALQVVAEGGVVYLNGEVITDEDREVAEEIAQRVPGVTRVVNDLRIQPPPLTGM